MLQSLEAAFIPGRRPWFRRRRRLSWFQGREVARLAWGRPAMKWGLTGRRGLSQLRRGTAVISWRQGGGTAARSGEGGALAAGSWSTSRRAVPARRRERRARGAAVVLRVLPLLILAAPLVAGLDLGPYLRPYREAVAPLLDRFRIDGDRAARLVAAAFPQGVDLGEEESLPAVSEGGLSRFSQGDPWSERARAWLVSLSRQLPQWLLVNELPALGRPVAQPVSARPVPMAPESGGTGLLPAGGDRPALPEVEWEQAPARPLPAPGEPVAARSRQEPLVLIYHSHISEMYHEPGQPLMEPSRYHRFNTTDTGVARTGAALARALEARGIPVLHDTGIYDYPSHSNAYALSGRAVAAILEKYPSIQAVIDLHRDTPAGMVTTVGGRQVARITLVVGTAAEPGPGGSPWQPNAAFARELAQALNELAPGVLDRILHVPNRRYNQELHRNAILVEVGSYHNTLAEAEAAAELLAASLARVLQARRVPGLTATPASEVPPIPDGVTPAGR